MDRKADKIQSIRVMSRLSKCHWILHEGLWKNAINFVESENLSLERSLKVLFCFVLFLSFRAASVAYVEVPRLGV